MNKINVLLIWIADINNYTYLKKTYYPNFSEKFVTNKKSRTQNTQQTLDTYIWCHKVWSNISSFTI